ncbi:MAG: phosphonate C-P lyase system protein PhnG [Arcobacteraceae bacterium]
MKREEINDLAQLVPIDKLEKFYNKINTTYNVKILTKPTEQTIIVPVKDPISGGSFYAGEVLVTSTIVQVEQMKGWSMIMDTDENLSLYTAVLDACFEADILKNEIIDLLTEAKNEKNEKIKHTNQKVNSTRVSFDLM